MYKETCSDNQIAKDEHQSFEAVGSSLLQAQNEKNKSKYHFFSVYPNVIRDVLFFLSFFDQNGSFWRG